MLFARLPLAQSAALPHTLQCGSLPLEPTSAPFANCCRRQTGRPWKRPFIADPGASPVIRGTGGLRKLRWAGSGRGKQGGIRTIYFRHARPEAIYLLTAYAKADREDLSPADRKVLSRLVAAIKKEERNQ